MTKNLKKRINFYLKKLTSSKLEKYGIDEIKVHSISYPNDFVVGKIFIDTEPLRKGINDSARKLIFKEIDTALKIFGEKPEEWKTYFNKRTLDLVDESLPFKETIKETERVRLFSESVDDSELKWHQDNEDRLVSPLHETDWMVQLDNQLPIRLNPNEKILIPEGVWHRVIKGSGDLKVKVKFI
jgi:hypothetical protein